MEDDGVGHIDPWSGQADGNRRVPDHQFGILFPGEAADASGQPWMGKQPGFTGAGDRESLLGVECCRTFVGRGVDRHVLGGEPPPQLPEVGLDAPHLGWEVVRDQQVRPHGTTSFPLARRASAQAACSPSIGSGDPAKR